MVFLDINTFYHPKSGGIRTYHLAKIEFFKTRPEHEYHLICPGPRRRSEQLAPNVWRHEFYGIPLTRARDGYRLLLGYVAIYALIRRIRPAVLEAGDPWLTGLFCLFIPLPPGTLRLSFYHSDPIDTYLRPWLQRRPWLPGGKALLRRLAACFYALQRRYDLTVVTSKVMQQKLFLAGVEKMARLPFGIDEMFFQKARERFSSAPPRREGPVRLLYAGRLDPEKGVDLLFEILPGLRAHGNLRLTVAGRGRYEGRFSELEGTEVEYVGFFSSREQMVRLYLDHDIFLAPGPYETFGLGVLEAMASGLVIVGADGGGTGDMLAELGSGFDFPPGDAGAFLEKIRLAAACDFAEEREKGWKVACSYGTWNEAMGRMMDNLVRRVEQRHA